MNNRQPILALAEQLIEINSITPNDNGCQLLIADRLKSLGFVIHHLRYGDVDNIWAEHGTDGPTVCFAGHTDVVPTGREEDWTNPPFIPTVVEDCLYGRGSADMKGSLAAMIVAAEEFISTHPNHGGKLAFLITSDEEGPAKDGTIRVIEWLKANNKKIDWCIVGEPTSSLRCGDVIKNGRRGSLSCQMIFHGIQGHVAYPDNALNPIHCVLPALTELTNCVWDQGNEFFPATSMQVSNFHSGTGATNIIPGSAHISFNFRFSTEVTASELKSRVESILNRYNFKYSLKWSLSGEPFITSKGELVDITAESIFAITGITPKLSTSGGTSDGRFIAPLGAQVIELGPINSSIHKIDEHVSINDLEKLSRIYERIISKLLK
jgi:succinyl-diaminopimelate desuccinylase